MGTLHNQPIRYNTIDTYCSTIYDCICDFYGIKRSNDRQKEFNKLTPDQILAACRAIELAERMQTMEAFDEQLSGIVEELHEMFYQSIWSKD